MSLCSLHIVTHLGSHTFAYLISLVPLTREGFKLFDLLRSNPTPLA